MLTIFSKNTNYTVCFDGYETTARTLFERQRERLKPADRLGEKTALFPHHTYKLYTETWQRPLASIQVTLVDEK